MNAIELQHGIISQILDIQDENFLEQLYHIVFSNNEQPVAIKGIEQKLISESLNDFESGKIITNDTVFEKSEKWLNE